MLKAVIFDIYDTLITHYVSPLYFGTQMAACTGIEKESFLKIWRGTESDRTIGKVTLEELLEEIFRINHCYSKEK